MNEVDYVYNVDDVEVHVTHRSVPCALVCQVAPS